MLELVMVFVPRCRRHKHRPTVQITREMLDELCLKYPQHEAAKIVGRCISIVHGCSNHVIEFLY